MIFYLGLLFIVGLMIAFTFVCAHEQNLDYWLNNFGITTSGEIIRRDDNTSRKAVRYYISYRFHPLSSTSQYEREQSISYTTYQKVNVGSTVTVVYYPANPIISRLGGIDADNQAVKVARLSGFASLLVGLWTIYPFMLYGERFFNEWQIRQRVRRSGIATRGDESSDNSALYHPLVLMFLWLIFLVILYWVCRTILSL